MINRFIDSMRKSLVKSELVHSVDGRRAQGRNGQQSSVGRSSEVSEETRNSRTDNDMRTGTQRNSDDLTKRVALAGLK